MLRTVSFLGLAFLTIAVVALNRRSERNTEIQPKGSTSNQDRQSRASICVVSQPTTHAYYAAFSLN